METYLKGLALVYPLDLTVRTVYPCTSLWSRVYSYDTVPSLSRHSDINSLLRVRLYLAFRLCLSGTIRPLCNQTYFRDRLFRCLTSLTSLFTLLLVLLLD
eukprot:jgi/Botrbrau1/23161/Bobra.0041s0012.1